jgi:hypothetical protein
MSVRALLIAAASASIASTAAANLLVTEVAPWSSGNSPTVAADWFELANTGNTPIDLTGYRFDDNSANFDASVALLGVTTLAPGETAIFLEGSEPEVTNFRAIWNVPLSVQVGTYTGSGIGLSTSGDAVNIYDAAGTLLTGVTFGSSPAAPGPFPTFDNTAGDVSLTTLSAVGVNGAYSVVDGAFTLIGSPGVAIPEPASLGLLAGAALLGLRRRQ